MRKSLHALGSLKKSKKNEVVRSGFGPRIQDTRPTLDVSSQPYEIQEAVAIVQSFTEGLIQIPCHGCKRKFTTLDIKSTFAEWQTDTGGRAPTLAIYARQCRFCQARTCLGCGKRYSGIMQNSSLETIDWCCDDGRVVTIWMTLCHFDSLFVDQERDKTEVKVLNGVKSTLGALTPNGTSNGTGYGDKGPGTATTGFSHYGAGGLVLNAPAVQLKQDSTSMDQTATGLINLLTSSLPSLEFEEFPVSLPYMLELSMVADKCAGFLRNDSLDNIMQRSAMYHSILNLVEKLGAHHGLCHIVHAERYSKRGSPGLQVISMGHNPNHSLRTRPSPIKLSEQKDGKDRSLVKGLENLALQSTVILKSSDGDPALKAMCQRISSVYNTLAQYRDEVAATSPQEQWAQFHKVNALSFSDDILKDFRADLVSEADAIATRLRFSRTDGARNKRILSECASMKTSLDDGTFVIVAESRPDMMKALIVGPQDTAYTHGLFEFDILLPEDYPRSPPKVYIHYPATVASPEVNPNLHPSGMVCLSLLGTWHQGDAASRWQPGLSTILQVLISIRAMVFVGNALHNEPTLEGRLVPAEVTRYNLHIQPLTVWAFMLTWLREEKMREGVWRDVVRMHFGIRGEEVLEVVRAWEAENPGGLSRWMGRLDFRLGGARHVKGHGLDGLGRVGVDLVTRLEQALVAMKDGVGEGEFEVLLRSLSSR